MQRIAKLRHEGFERLGQWGDEVVKVRGCAPVFLPVIKHQREHRRQALGLRVLVAIQLATGDDVAQQLEQHPVLGLALVLEEQVNREVGIAIRNLVDQVGVDLAQGLGDEGVGRDDQPLQIEIEMGQQPGWQGVPQEVARDGRGHEVLAKKQLCGVGVVVIRAPAGRWQ